MTNKGKKRIYVKIHPRSAMNKIIFKSEGEGEAWVTAPPVKGAANRALIELTAKYFDVSKSCVSIVGGQTTKIKIIDILE